MSRFLILTVGVIYLVTAADLLARSNPPMALVFFAYALANLGLYFAVE